MFSKPKHSHLELFEGIIIGGSLVAAATFLFGTKKGKAIQRDLVRQYKKVGRVTHDMKEKFEKAIHTGIAKTKRKVAKAKRTAKRIKSTAKRESKRIKAKAKRVKRSAQAERREEAA